MLSPPPSEVEFPSEISVEDWELFLLERYCSRDLEKSPKDRSRMITLKVLTIRRYKEREHVEHEYLVAEVADPDLDRPHYLRIERAVDDTLPRTANDHTTARSPLSTPGQSTLSLTSQSSLGVLSKVPARDHVTKMAAWPTKDICIVNLKCQNSEMILHDLAIVAKVVHDHSEKYQLFKRQCFWYSDVITGVLELHFHQITKAAVSDSSLSADHASEAEMDVFDKLRGTYKKVKIYERRMDAIEEIHAIFDAYKSDIESSILKAEQAVRKAQEEARKDKEEARKYKEEAQKNKEAQKTIERVLKEKEEERKEKEEARKKMEEAQKEKERVLKENALLRRRMQEFEGKVGGGTTSL